MKRTFTLLSAFALLLSVLALPASANSIPRPLTFGNNGNQEPFYRSTAEELAGSEVTNYSEVDEESGFYDKCPGVRADEVGWHFLHPAGEFTELEVIYELEGVQFQLTLDNATNEDEDHQGERLPDNGHVYFATAPNTVLLNATASGIGGQSFFVLSHVCTGEEEVILVDALLSGRKLVEGVFPPNDLLAGFQIVVYDVDDSDSPTTFDEVASTTTGPEGIWDLQVGPYVAGTEVSLAVCEAPRADWEQVSPAEGDANTIVGPQGTICHLVEFTAVDGVEPQAFENLNFTNLTESLEVTKTAETSFVRTHDWSVTKTVETEFGYELDDAAKIWLYTDGRGDEAATWTVSTTYEGFEDDDFAVSGEITIENTGPSAATITAVTDVFDIEVDPEPEVACGVDLPYVLPAGETLTCTYSAAVDGPDASLNTATVVTERDTYAANAPVEWSEVPTTETHATVDVRDVSDLFGAVDLGTLRADDYAPGEGEIFTYPKAFAWSDYGRDGCGSYEYGNTASVVGDNGDVLDSDNATLKVNVQCFNDETAYAEADDETHATCFIPTFRNWGWTNGPIGVGEYTWPLYAGAAHCDTDRGTPVGTVSVDYVGRDDFTATYNLFDGFDLVEDHTYAGSDEFPQVRRGRNTVSTVAPGQYYIDVDGEPIHVIAHAVVGIPNPDFGPAE